MTGVTTPPGGGGLVGRRSLPSQGHQASVRKSASGPRDVIRHIASMTISRDGLPVAAVSTYTSALMESDIDKPNAQTSGDVSGTSGEMGYLQVKWDFPTDTQVGRYVCTVTGITEAGHSVILTKHWLLRKLLSI